MAYGIGLSEAVGSMAPWHTKRSEVLEVYVSSTTTPLLVGEELGKSTLRCLSHPKQQQIYTSPNGKIFRSLVMVVDFLLKNGVLFFWLKNIQESWNSIITGLTVLIHNFLIRILQQPRNGRDWICFGDEAFRRGRVPRFLWQIGVEMVPIGVNLVKYYSSQVTKTVSRWHSTHFLSRCYKMPGSTVSSSKIGKILSQLFCTGWAALITQGKSCNGGAAWEWHGIRKASTGYFHVFS